MKKIILAILAIFGIRKIPEELTTKLKEGLRSTLESTSKIFEKINHAYLINIIKDDTVILQIVHGGLIEQVRTRRNTFNFSFNLAFDNEEVNLEKFKALEIPKEFTFYEWNGIPCYAINVRSDKKKTENIAFILLEDVYGFGADEMFEFQIFNQGKMY